MKTYLPYSLILAAAASGMASGAETAYTTPVGYITSTIGPNRSGSSAGAATFIGAALVQPATFAGAASGTVSPSGGTVITFTGGVPTGLGISSMLEITSAIQKGWWTSIASSTATTITVTDVLPAGLPANLQISVRNFSTIQNVFGNNSPGLTVYGTGPYDEIQLLKPDIQEVSVIVYAGGGWVNLATELPANNEIIYPGTAVKVIHRANTSLSVVTSGEVKTTPTQVDIFPKDNWFAQPNPTNQTFGNLNLGPQIGPTDSVDVIQTDGGSGQVVTTYVSSSGVMYNLATEADATPIDVKSAEGFLLKRVGAANTLTLPVQVVAP